MISGKLIKLTGLLLIISIAFTIAASVLQYVYPKDLSVYIPKAQLIFSAITSVFVYSIFYKYFEAIRHQQAKQSSLIVGICIIVMSLFKALDLYDNKMTVIIISVFFIVSYIFWIVTILRHKENTEAYNQVKYYIFCTLGVLSAQILLQVYLIYTEQMLKFTEERVLTSAVINQLPWIFYFNFLGKVNKS